MRCAKHGVQKEERQMAGVPGVVLAGGGVGTGRDGSWFDDPDDVEADDFSEGDDVTF